MDVNVNLSGASIVPDKGYWGLFLGSNVVRVIRNCGCDSDSLKISYNPEEIAGHEIDGESIFRIPITLLRDSENKKFVVPIFMVILTTAQKNELKSIAESRNFVLLDKHFFKPKIVYKTN